MEVVYVISLVVICLVQIIMIIAFFKMAINIGYIKNNMFNLQHKDSSWYIRQGEMEEYVGNKTKAKEYYQKALYLIKKVEHGYNNANDLKNKINSLD
ncbi:MAG: hypothetical protein MR298_01855 [Odoribacter sp.]|nr:hypothetical protein [Odoribacter sp.]